MVANDLSGRYTDILEHMVKHDEIKPEVIKPMPNPVAYLGEVGSSTIDLVGEPAFKDFFKDKTSVN